jgi:hypothetical protein
MRKVGGTAFGSCEANSFFFLPVSLEAMPLPRVSHLLYLLLAVCLFCFVGWIDATHTLVFEDEAHFKRLTPQTVVVLANDTNPVQLTYSLGCTLPWSEYVGVEVWRFSFSFFFPFFFWSSDVFVSSRDLYCV